MRNETCIPIMAVDPTGSNPASHLKEPRHRRAICRPGERLSEGRTPISRRVDESLPARYSFTALKSGERWLIVDHHSSAMPNRA
jgi:hypothetical protein